MPTAQPSPTPEGCQEREGRVEMQEIASQHLPKPLVVRVFLPPCYAAKITRPYPLLLMLHGQAANDDQWERLGLLSAAGRMMGAGSLPPFLIAMPLMT